ncbi:TPA: nucleoside deaminase [Candidatus Bathyarchaeota archaeon]|nr:nucleoside deaminase [Candidatus Bathyarchaeota archaeon]
MSVHDPFMRRAFDLAASAAFKGNHPFGAVLVNAGEVVLLAENTVNTSGDQTRHAELNLIAEARRTHPREFLAECTLYASTAPCPMCVYAIWESGITRVVYGVIYEKFAKLITKDAPYIKIEDIYRLLKTPAQITGGVLEEEGTRVYRHWPKK